MFGFALLAAWRPPHEDWLNEWSSTPPTSRTMQALRLPPAVVVSWLLGDDAVSVALGLLESAGLEHPANSRDAAPTAAAILKAWRKRFLLNRPPPPLGGKMFGLTLVHRCGYPTRQGPTPRSVTER